MRGRLLTLAVALMAFVLVSCGGGTAEEGASDLTYSPNPFYDDLDRMSVSFKTSGPAREGFEYIVWLSITGPDVDLEECAA